MRLVWCSHRRCVYSSGEREKSKNAKNSSMQNMRKMKNCIFYFRINAYPNIVRHYSNEETNFISKRISSFEKTAEVVPTCEKNGANRRCQRNAKAFQFFSFFNRLMKYLSPGNNNGIVALLIVTNYVSIKNLLYFCVSFHDYKF